MPPKSQGTKAKLIEEEHEGGASIEIIFSGTLALLHPPEPILGVPPEKGDAAPEPVSPKKGKAPKVEEVPVKPTLEPSAILKEPYFAFHLPGELEPRKTRPIESVDFSVVAATFSFAVTKEQIMALGNDITVMIMSNEAPAEGDNDASAPSPSPKNKSKKETTKKEKAAASKKASAPSTQHVPVAGFVFNMAPIVLGAKTHTLLMRGEDPTLQDNKARQPVYGFDSLSVQCTLSGKRIPLLTEEQSMDWFPMMITVLNLSNMADNSIIHRSAASKQEPDYTDLRQSCVGVYTSYHLLPNLPPTLTPQFTHARNIGIHHNALFFLGDILQPPGSIPSKAGTIGSVLGFIQHYFSQHFEVEIHDRDLKESLADVSSEDTTGLAHPKSSNTSHFGRSRFTLHTLINGDLTFKANEQVVPHRAAGDIEKHKVTDPAQAASMMMNFDLSALFNEHPSGTDSSAASAPSSTALNPIFVQRGRYLEWQSTIRMKFVLAKPIPQLLFLLPPERPLLRSAGEISVATGCGPGSSITLASNFVVSMAQPLPCSPFTRAVIIIPLATRPTVLQTLLNAIMLVNRASSLDDDVMVAPPVLSIASEPFPEEDKPKEVPKKPRAAETDKKVPVTQRKTPVPSQEKEDSISSQIVKATGTPGPSQKTTTQMWQRRQLPVTVTDTISGFEVIDGSHRIFVLEALAGSGMKHILDPFMAELKDADAVKVLFNPNIPFPKREYIGWPPLTKMTSAVPNFVSAIEEDDPAKPTKGKGGVKKTKEVKKDVKAAVKKEDRESRAASKSIAEPLQSIAAQRPTTATGTLDEDQLSESIPVDGVGGRIRRIRLRRTIDWVLAQQSNYLKRRSTDLAPRCIEKLARLSHAVSMQTLVNDCLFPAVSELIEMEILYGICLSNQDQSGAPDQIIVDGIPQAVYPNRPPAETLFDAPQLGSFEKNTYPSLEPFVHTEKYNDTVPQLKDLHGRHVRLIGLSGKPKDLPPANMVCQEMSGPRCWFFIPDIQQWVLLLLGQSPKPGKPLPYATEGVLQTCSVAENNGGVLQFATLQVSSLQEAFTLNRANQFTNKAYIQQQASERNKLPFTEYARVKREQLQWYADTHTHSRHERARGANGEEDLGSTCSSETLLNFADIGMAADAKLVEPPRFPSVVPNHRLVNKLKYTSDMSEGNSPNVDGPPGLQQTQAANRSEMEGSIGPGAVSPVAGKTPAQLQKELKFQRAFKLLQQKSALEDNRHPKKPSESRIEDLRQPWDIYVQKFDKQPDRNFDLYRQPPDPSPPEGLQRTTPKQEFTQKLREETDWRSKVVVDNPHFHVHMNTTDIPDALDKYTRGLLRDKPQKYSVKMAQADRPAPTSIFGPEPCTTLSDSRSRSLRPGLTLLDEEDALMDFYRGHILSPTAL